MSSHMEHRKLAAIIPLCGTDMMGYRALAQSKLPRTLEPVPQGRSKTAQRFIAGLHATRGKVPEGRQKVVFAAKDVGSILSPLRGLLVRRRIPSIETLGYCLSPSGLEP